MRELKESLLEYGEVMLRALAAQWGAPAGDVEALPEQLALRMLDPERLRAFVAALDPAAQAALAQVAAAGGAIRGYLLTRNHGDIRRLGPRAIERETPWQNPAGATERIYYAGLIFRRYGRLGAYHGEIYYIPPDLLAALPPLQAPSEAALLQPAPPPAAAWEDEDALTLDVEALLARLRLQPVPAERGSELPQTFVSTLSGRWRGAPDQERMALAQRLALGLRLIRKRRGVWQVSRRAQTWLQLSPYRRQKTLFDAWQADPHWNELRRIPSLRCEDTGWRNDPVSARNAVLKALRNCRGWLRLDGLVASIKATQPDFARPDGDYDSWYIRDVRTGQYLQGFAHWEDVEGALILHLVTRSLFWLGAVALGSADGGPIPTVFRLTTRGRALLRLEGPPATGPTEPLSVREDLSILVPRAGSAYDRARLEQFARWEGREGQSDLYRLEPELVWQALNAGIDARRIAGFLQRAAGRPLPAAAVQALRTWGEGFGRVTLQRAILLQAENAETLRQLVNDPELAQRLGSTVSEQAVLVPEEELPHVLARLKALQLWPRLVGLTPSWPQA